MLSFGSEGSESQAGASEKSVMGKGCVAALVRMAEVINEGLGQG